ncbi:hypothetical protein C8R45DRAFT_1081183 [Mycena sanguinolenta]|nr:hypothetical protein C8R45DRAFT_1081183 [Mycena sanguinolenta]
MLSDSLVLRCAPTSTESNEADLRSSISALRAPEVLRLGRQVDGLSFVNVKPRSHPNSARSDAILPTIDLPPLQISVPLQNKSWFLAMQQGIIQRAKRQIELASNSNILLQSHPEDPIYRFRSSSDKVQENGRTIKIFLQMGDIDTSNKCDHVSREEREGGLFFVSSCFAVDSLHEESWMGQQGKFCGRNYSLALHLAALTSPPTPFASRPVFAERGILRSEIWVVRLGLEKQTQTSR